MAQGYVPSASPFLSCRPQSFGPAAASAYEHLAGMGVGHVEIPLPKPEDGERVAAELRRHGLQVGSVQAPCDTGSPTVAEDLGEAARRASGEFGAKYIFTSAHAGKRDRQAVYETLRRVGDAVARHGVTLLLETHPDLGTNGEVAAQTMQAVAHPNVRVNWDPANVVFYNEGCDGRAEFDRAVPYVGGVHLKDTEGGYRAWAFGTLGEGVVDFGYILGRLVSSGFRGPCTMEIEGVRGEQLTPEQHVERVRRSVEYLRGLGFFRT